LTGPSGERPNLSVIITCFNEAEGIEEFTTRLIKTLSGLGRSYEVVAVNDGSSDDTWAKLKAFQEGDAHVIAVDLFKNAGQTRAMAAGIEAAGGEHFVFMDCDLQLDPEELPLLLAEFDKGLDVVSGARTERRDSLFRRLASLGANSVMRRAAQAPLTDFGCTFKVFRGALIRAFGFGPDNPFDQVRVIAKAGRVEEIPVSHHPRKYGTSGWTLPRLWQFHMDHVVLLSERLFQYLSLFGLLVAALTALRVSLAWVLPHSVLAIQPTTGLLLNAMLLSSAFLIAVVAVVGEYVIRAFNRQVRGPLYVVRERLPRRSS
jgi:glycosyltransferase involved in cell wall biosynthesis